MQISQIEIHQLNTEYVSKSSVSFRFEIRFLRQASMQSGAIHYRSNSIAFQNKFKKASIRNGQVRYK